MVELCHLEKKAGKARVIGPIDLLKVIKQIYTKSSSLARMNFEEYYDRYVSLYFLFLDPLQNLGSFILESLLLG
jgi:hypothetical protein